MLLSQPVSSTPVRFSPRHICEWTKLSVETLSLWTPLDYSSELNFHLARIFRREGRQSSFIKTPLALVTLFGVSWTWKHKSIIRKRVSCVIQASKQKLREKGKNKRTPPKKITMELLNAIPIGFKCYQQKNKWQLARLTIAALGRKDRTKKKKCFWLEVLSSTL